MLVAMAADVSKASIFHEAPLEILRLAPSLVLELLEAAHQPFATNLSGGRREPIEVVIADSQLADPLPHLRAADFVAIVRTKTRAQCVVVEVQRARAAAKKSEWPYYASYLELRLDMPVFFVILTFDDGVARWARHSPPMGSITFTPLVLGPSELRENPGEDSPAISTLKAIVELAGLEKHRDVGERERAEASVIAALTALLKLAPSPTRNTFVNLIHGTAAKPFRARLEQLLEDFGMGALDLIKQEGRREGREEGLAEGKETALRDALLSVLEVRGFVPSSVHLARIAAAGVGELVRWHKRALEAARIDEVFET